MKGKFLVMFVLGFSMFFLSSENLFAQRKSVSGKEVTGIFRYNFTGKFKGNSSEIKILALGGGKLKIQFDLVYPFVTGNGEMSANVGQAGGEAKIEGDTAIYSTSEDGMCKIVIKFVKAGQIEVTQEQEGTGCGFGFNVSASGTYKKISGVKPKFESL